MFYVVGAGSMPPSLPLLGFGLVLGTAVTDGVPPVLALSSSSSSRLRTFAFHHLFDFRPSEGFIFKRPCAKFSKRFLLSMIVFSAKS